MAKPKGWRGEPHRHSLAGKGVKTTYETKLGKKITLMLAEGKLKLPKGVTLEYEEDEEAFLFKGNDEEFWVLADPKKGLNSVQDIEEALLDRGGAMADYWEKAKVGPFTIIHGSGEEVEQIFVHDGKNILYMGAGYVDRMGDTWSRAVYNGLNMRLKPLAGEPGAIVKFKYKGETYTHAFMSDEED